MPLGTWAAPSVVQHPSHSQLRAMFTSSFIAEPGPEECNLVTVTLNKEVRHNAAVSVPHTFQQAAV